jgi:hypothetical protein
MSNPNDPYVERTVVEEPATVRREVTREPGRGGSAGWWVAALVAVVAVIGALYLFSSNRNAELQAARDSGRAEAMVDNATADAQQAALSATQASRAAADNMARSTAAAAESARQAAEQTTQDTRDAAANAADAATDAGAPASDTAPDSRQ